MVKLLKTILAKNIRKMFFCKHFLINTKLHVLLFYDNIQENHLHKGYYKMFEI